MNLDLAVFVAQQVNQPGEATVDTPARLWRKLLPLLSYANCEQEIWNTSVLCETSHG